MNNFISPKVAGICGIIAAVVSLSSIFIAISVSPWFTWTGSWLSDLGRTIFPSAVIFNNGLITAGILGVIFSIGIRRLKAFSGEQAEWGLAMLFLATLSLSFVGFYPVEAGMLHTLASFLFFVFSIFTLILMGNVLRKSHHGYGHFILLLGICSAVSFPFFFFERPWGMNAVVEMVSSVSMSVFILTYSIHILLSGRKPHS